MTIKEIRIINEIIDDLRSANDFIDIEYPKDILHQSIKSLILLVTKD